MFKHIATYGCSCGCGSCGGADPSYGASLKIGGSGGGGTKWEWDVLLFDNADCPKYREKVNAYEKARAEFDALPSFLGIRAGGKNSKMEKLVKRLKKLKREGEAIGKKCESRMYSSDPAALKTMTPEEAVAAAGGAPDATSDEGLGPIVYILGAGILGLGALLGYRAYAQKKAAQGAAR
jgi:hypothetical protein